MYSLDSVHDKNYNFWNLTTFFVFLLLVGELFWKKRERKHFLGKIKLDDAEGFKLVCEMYGPVQQIRAYVGYLKNARKKSEFASVIWVSANKLNKITYYFKRAPIIEREFVSFRFIKTISDKVSEPDSGKPEADVAARCLEESNGNAGSLLFTCQLFSIKQLKIPFALHLQILPVMGLFMWCIVFQLACMFSKVVWCSSQIIILLLFDIFISKYDGWSWTWF